MNLVILIEQSYIDSNIKNHLIKLFYTKYNLNYKNRSYGGIPGNIGSLVGRYTTQQFKKTIKSIILDLEQYHPFIRFVGLNFKTYWISRLQLNEITKLELNETANIQLATSYIASILSYHQAFNEGIYTIITLLSNKDKDAPTN